MKLTFRDFMYLAPCLEGFFYGLYSGIFAMYLQYHASKNSTDRRTNNILFYALCTLYVLSSTVISLDIATFLSETPESIYHSVVSCGIIFGCCDFISQCILIYRCWIVWGRNIRVVIIPSILALAFLGAWLVSTTAAMSLSSGKIYTFDWGSTMTITALAISMTVNILVMGLIVLKIFKVFREVKATLDEQKLGATGGSKLRSIIFILIESGMALFSVQLLRLVLTILPPTNATAAEAFGIIASVHEMINGITPTIILVRVSMGLSFHDEDSMVKATASLCFAPDNSTPEMGSIVRQDSESGDDDIGVRLSDEIRTVDLG